jgi:deoxycytidylate deaminase
MSHEQYFREAGKVAEKALCLRDKCGAVIVKDGEIIGRGYNAPPKDDITMRKCHLELVTSPKPKSDRTCCMHAEWRAILDALSTGKIVGSVLYFVRVNDSGDLKESNSIPYCTVCSRLALDTGIAQFGLWTKDGTKMFETKEYNELSYQFHLANNN